MRAEAGRGRERTSRRGVCATGFLCAATEAAAASCVGVGGDVGFWDRRAWAVSVPFRASVDLRSLERLARDCALPVEAAWRRSTAS